MVVSVMLLMRGDCCFRTLSRLQAGAIDSATIPNSDTKWFDDNNVAVVRVPTKCVADAGKPSFR